MGPFTSEDLESRWQRPSADPLANTFNIDATSLASFVRLKAHFSAASFSADALVVVDVCIVVSSPSPIEFSKLRVSFSESAYDESCVLDGAVANENNDDDDPEAESPLLFEPGVVKAFRFHFSPRIEDVGNSLRITSVSLHLGDPARRCAVLTWNEGGGDIMSTAATAANQTALPMDDSLGGASSAGYPFWQRPPPKRKLSPEEEWKFIPRGVTTTRIESRPPRVALKITHAPPCLVNEFYVVHVAVNNEEDVMITDVSLSVDLLNTVGAAVDSTQQQQQQQQQQTLEDSTHLFLDIPTSGAATTPPPRFAEIPLPDLEAGQSCVKTIYVKVTQPGERKFAVLANYAIDAEAEKPIAPLDPLHSSSNVVPALVNAALADAETPPRGRCLCLASTEFSMQSMRPFQIVTKPLTAKFDSTEVVFDGEPFLLTCDIKCISEWPILIKTSHLEISDSMMLPDSKLNFLAFDNYIS